MNDNAKTWAAITAVLDPVRLDGDRGRLVRAARFLALSGKRPSLSAASRAAGIVRTTANSWVMRDPEFARVFAQAQRTAPIENPVPVFLDVSNLDAEIESIAAGHEPSSTFTTAVLSLLVAA